MSRSTVVSIFLVFGIIVTQAFDVWSTLVGLSLGAREANPIMVPIVDNFWALIAVKATVTILVAAATWKRPAAAGAFVAFYLVVGANNWNVLNQLR